MDKLFLGFIIVGLLLFGALLFFQNPVESAIPPTPAFSVINTTLGNVTATSYDDLVTFLGSGVTITPDYSLNTITFGVTGSGGENNTAANLSPGIGLFLNKSGVVLQFKSLAPGNNITIDSNETSVTISAAGSVGEANTMSSPTHANSLILAKSGVDLPIKGIACSGSITCSANTTDITLDYTTPASSGFTNITPISTSANATLINSNSSNSATFKNIGAASGITVTNGSNTVIIGTNFLANTISGVAGSLLYSFDSITGNFVSATIKNPLLDGSNHTDTTSSAPTRGDIMYVPSSGLWDDLAIGASNTYLKSDGTDVSWATVTATAREETVALWETDRTWTNIGSSYVDVYATANSNGEGVRIDTTGKTTATINIMWTKVGAGTQKCGIIDITNFANILIEHTNLANGQNTNATVNIPAGLANTIKTYKPMCLSTTATDDPTWLSGQVLLK